MIGKLSRHVTADVEIRQVCFQKGRGNMGNGSAFKASVSTDVMNPLIPEFSKVT